MEGGWEIMIIRNNIAGINSNRNKGIAETKMKKNLEKLSTGYRINRAGDDAAGLAISELMRSQIGGIDQALRNCNDGISMTNTGEGALTEVHAMLQRMKTLAVQSANGTYTSEARANLDAERVQLLDELNRIGANSNFDGIPLFKSGEPKGYPDIEPPTLAEDEKERAITLQIGYSQAETLDVGRYYMSDKALLLNDTKFTTLTDANEAIPKIETAIEAVADIRANFGANLNHMEHTHNNLTVTSENMTTAESRIRDTKMAEEFVAYTKENIVYQSSTSMAAQANSTVQQVLSLLQ